MKKILLLILLLVSSISLYAQGRMPNTDNMRNEVAKRAAEYNKELQKQKEEKQGNSVRQNDATRRANQQINENRQQAAFLDNNFQAGDFMTGPSDTDLSSFSSIQNNAQKQERTSLLELEGDGTDTYNNSSAPSNKLEERNDGFIIDNGGSWWDEAIRKGDIWQKNAKEKWEKQFGARRCKYKPNECFGQSRPIPDSDLPRTNRTQPQVVQKETKTKKNKKDNIPDYKLEKPRRYMEIKRRNYTPLPESQYTSSTQQRSSIKARYMLDNSNGNKGNSSFNNTDTRSNNQHSKNATTKKSSPQIVDNNNHNGGQIRRERNNSYSEKAETNYTKQTTRQRNPKAAKINRNVSMKFVANQFPKRTQHGDKLDDAMKTMYENSVMWQSGGPFEIEHKNGETNVYMLDYKVSSKGEIEMKKSGYVKMIGK